MPTEKKAGYELKPTHAVCVFSMCRVQADQAPSRLQSERGPYAPRSSVSMLNLCSWRRAQSSSTQSGLTRQGSCNQAAGKGHLGAF